VAYQHLKDSLQREQTCFQNAPQINSKIKHQNRDFVPEYQKSFLQYTGMKSQNNSTPKNLNEESQNLSVNQPEQNCSQKQNAVSVTNLNNNEESTCKNVPEQQNVEKKILKIKKKTNNND